MHTFAKITFAAAASAAVLLMAPAANAAEEGSTNPLGVSVDVPLSFENNAIGTPFGQWDAPEFHARISADI